jgi:hypothetical protein
LKRPWFRRYHRWLGGLAAFFVLLLAVTGVALNHGNSWKLDRTYVPWHWVVNLYGIEAPQPDDSFSSDGRRATLMGGMLFFERIVLAEDVRSLEGIVSTQGIYVLASDSEIILTTPEGELVDRIDLKGVLPGSIQRLGLKDGAAVVQSRGRYYFSDPDLNGFEARPDEPGTGIDWSDASPAPQPLVADLQNHFLGQALTVERLLLDVHSGRIAGTAGVWFMDFIALSLIVLSITGLVQWRRRNGNGQKSPR